MLTLLLVFGVAAVAAVVVAAVIATAVAVVVAFVSHLWLPAKSIGRKESDWTF